MNFFLDCCNNFVNEHGRPTAILLCSVCSSQKGEEGCNVLAKYTIGGNREKFFRGTDVYGKFPKAS